MSSYEIIQGDCLEVMKTMPDNSIDMIVSDPPYGISFMCKAWDHGVPGEPFWAEMLRIAKPGAWLISFSGTRTYHFLAMGVYLAGWEIRDMGEWIYGSGFPKSLDVSKAIDKLNGETGRLHKFTKWMRSTGLTASQINAITNTCMGSHYLTDKSQPAIPTPDLWAVLRPNIARVPSWVDVLVERVGAEREVVGVAPWSSSVNHFTVAVDGSDRITCDITAPKTPQAQQFDDYKTALKPAHEPFVIARKPFDCTVAENCLEWGTGAFNIGGGRIECSDKSSFPAGVVSNSENILGNGEGMYANRARPQDNNPKGRYPSNLIHDGSPEALSIFPCDDNGSKSKFFYCSKASKEDREEGLEAFKLRKLNRVNSGGLENDPRWAPIERANDHATVKPTDLMRYLVRLLKPPNEATCLDPFCGSGSTGKACMIEGVNFIGIDLDAHYCDIARARCEYGINYEEKKATKLEIEGQGRLF